MSENDSLPQPPMENKQPVDATDRSGELHSSDKQELPLENKTANFQTGNRLPARSTRNPNPVYVDAITLQSQQTGPPPYKGFSTNQSWSPKPWSASEMEIDALNHSISNHAGTKPHGGA